MHLEDVIFMPITRIARMFFILNVVSIKGAMYALEQTIAHMCSDALICQMLKVLRFNSNL